MCLLFEGLLGFLLHRARHQNQPRKRLLELVPALRVPGVCADELMLVSAYLFLKSCKTATFTKEH